jgi:integrase
MSEPIMQYLEEFLEFSKNQEKLNEKTKRVRRNVLKGLEENLKTHEDDIFLQNHSEVKFKVNRFFQENESRSPNPPAIFAITKFFRYLRDETDYYERNEVRNCIEAVLTLKKTYKESSSLKRVKKGNISFNQKERIIRACRSSERDPLKKEVMARLIMEAGFSRSELLALKREYVDFESAVNPITIEVVEKWDQNLNKEIPKDEPRYVAASLETRVKIRELIKGENRGMDDYLIWENPSYSKPQRWLDDIIESAGIERQGIKIKDLGRNAIVDLVEKGIRQHRIQEYIDSRSAVSEDVVDKFSLKSQGAHPLAQNKKLF